MVLTEQHGAGQNNIRHFLLALVALLAYVIYQRSAELYYALPYFKYVDEGHVLLRVAHMLRNHTLDPGWYRYPPLTMYVVLLLGLCDGILTVPQGHALYDIIEPSALIFLGRAAIFSFYLGTIVLVALSARRLAGNAAGITAAVCTAFLPALALRSTIVIVDTVACFFSAAVLYVLVRAQQGQANKRLNFIGGFLSGLACTAKYPAGALVLSLYRRPFAATALGYLSGVIIGMPPLLWRLPAILRDIQTQSHIYATKSSAETYLQAAFQLDEFGLAFILLVATAFVVFLCNRTQRAVFYAWCPFSLVFCAALLTSNYQPFRNILPLIPFICLVSGCAIANALAYAGIGPTPKMLLGPLILLGVNWHFAFERERPVIDSRTQTVNWIRTHIKANEPIMISKLIGFHPEELRTLPNPIESLPGKSSYFVVPAKDPRMQGRYELLARFGKRDVLYSANFWRTNNQAIVVLKSAAGAEHTASRVPLPSTATRGY